MTAARCPRVAIIGFALESNRNAPVSDRRAFTETLYLDAPGIERELRGDRAGLPGTVRGFCAEMDATGDWSPVPVLLAEAPPGGPADHAFFLEMLESMRGGLRRSGALDGVYISEHGAGLTTETDDADGAVFAMARDVVGPDVPIIATLDLHGHVTSRMQTSADVLVAYLTNPHVDQEERGREAARLMTAMTNGMRTCSTLVRVPMISPSVSLLTAEGPYADLIQFGQTFAKTSILNVSILAGFAPADAITNGMSIVVTASADVADGPAAAQKAANELAARAWADRHRYAPNLTAIDEAIDQAAVVATDPKRPAILLADVADNPGGGGRGNTVYLMRRLLEAKVQGVVIGMMIDPALAAEAHQLGVGARFAARFNRDDDNPFSEPYLARACVEKLVEGPCVGRRGIYAGRRIDLGPCALLVIEGIQVVVASRRHQCADPLFLERMGINISVVRVLVIKSRGHFRAGFDEHFPPRQIIEVDAPGLTTPILSRLGLNRVRRPVYPLDPDMEWQVPR